ncbi:transmembrane anterior posterior transformation 1 homolog [Paramuricea clavata]|uniref:Transmembrane anterior posterior transformation 1 homolog n=1 Tax=Paramuricea clavata TaxID=317549 RepID=A0A6S7GBR1_PARCT|nr:transmembrane anterior posterior transformation 1 homolog [Paramuricea clavata]
MEDINKTSQTQEEHLNKFEKNKKDTNCSTDSENAELENTDEQNVPNSVHNSSDISNTNSNSVKSENNSENSEVNEPCNSITNELISTDHGSSCPETPTNFTSTYTTTHNTVHKRNTGNTESSKQSAKSEQEFVIHHEHCENLDGVSNNDSFENIKDSKSSVQERKPVDLPEYLIKGLTQNTAKGFSLFHYLKVEVTRGYLFEEQEEKFLDQREKIYTFMKTPRELEKLMWFGFLLCLDCFLFVFTYLPVRVLLAMLQLLGNVVCLKFLRNTLSLLEPHQTCDLLRGFILLVCCVAMNSWCDLSILYHIVRGQSVIKLYVIYNMLDIADRLFSSIGQDTLDALFWTGAEPRQKRRFVMIILHFGLASVYVFLHALLVLFQAITLNVAINSHNKVLMVVMVSNQFVELKGCVFKKFEKNNLFQMSCADIRERFYYVVLVSLVTLRNMHELQWNLDHLYELVPSVALLLCSEVFVDWVKHAFITKFNCISSEVYREYRELLALDAATSRLFGQQRACSDHFDLVSRRLGFIPLPLGCVVYRVTSQSVQISGTAGIVVLVLVYLWLTSVKILNSIILLGLSSHYVMNKTSNINETKPNMESSPSPSDLQLPVSDPLDRDQNKVGTVSKPRQVKALNEIDRYTLCSNRIV